MSASERHSCSPNRWREARPHAQAGFTLVEAMISMVILAVGVLGVASMQTAATGATRNAQDFTHAQGIGEKLMELLRVDALRWTSATTLTGSTKLLGSALPATQTAGQQGSWTTIPDNVIISSLGGLKVDRNFAPDTGTAVDWAIGFRYCVYYRTAWVSPPSQLRVDVRVAWPRDSGDQSKLANCRTDAANVSDIANVRTISMSTTLMINTSI